MIDARGQSCPIPVVMVQNAVRRDHPDVLQIRVDSMVCVENISRFAASQGYTVAVAEDCGEFTLTLKK